MWFLQNTGETNVYDQIRLAYLTSVNSLLTDAYTPLASSEGMLLVFSLLSLVPRTPLLVARRADCAMFPMIEVVERRMKYLKADRKEAEDTVTVGPDHS